MQWSQVPMVCKGTHRKLLDCLERYLLKIISGTKTSVDSILKVEPTFKAFTLKRIMIDLVGKPGPPE